MSIQRKKKKIYNIKSTVRKPKGQNGFIALLSFLICHSKFMFYSYSHNDIAYVTCDSKWKCRVVHPKEHPT